MKTIYICVGEPLTGKTILANSLKESVYVKDEHTPDFMTNLNLVDEINKVYDRNVFFIVCHEYPSDLILALDLYLEDKCKVIVCENRVVINKESSE